MTALSQPPRLLVGFSGNLHRTQPTVLRGMPFGGQAWINRDEVVMVGDQLMTDIRASHRAGIRSILVKPLVQSDAWVTKFNRWRERRMWKKIEKAYGPMTFNKGI